MKYYWKIFKWEDGKKVDDLSKFLTLPIFLEPKIDGTLKTGEVILDEMPISTKKAFNPKTKIRIEKYMTNDFSDRPKVYDYVVDSDQVEEYVGCPNICCHRINLIDPSVITQNMLVDNIALTYEMQDVSLKYKTMKTRNDKVVLVTNPYVGGGLPYTCDKPLKLGLNYFRNSYRYFWQVDEDYNKIANTLRYQNALKQKTYTFQAPRCICEGTFANGWQKICEIDLVAKIIRRHFRGATLLSEEITDKKIYSEMETRNIKNTTWNTITTWALNPGSSIPPQKNRNISRIKPFSDKTTGLVVSINDLSQFNENIDAGSTITTANDGKFTDRRITFTTDILSQEQLDNDESITYQLLFEPLLSNLPISYEKTATVKEVTGPAGYSVTSPGYGTTMTTSKNSIYLSITINVINMLEETIGSKFLCQSRKYNCLDLLRKAMLTCDTYVIDNSKYGLDTIYNENGEECGIKYPIYIDDDLRQKLMDTQMYESVFEQKNLWEILLQIGYYLHAIPYLEFLDGDDRFQLKFRKLGKTDKNNKDNSIKTTIFNSQNLSEYYTQFDSYVTNLFSPQNEVSEYLVPKTSDSNFLISNDTAELNTQYNIYEILDFKISNGRDAPRSAIENIFEKTVYSILPSNPEVSPSKSSSIFYELGNSKIMGLNYVPTEINSGDEPLAIQKIISLLFGQTAGEVGKIKVNDYSFYIKYRTQDSLRISQVRPDIHKFMKNTKYERYPHHSQFYGQEDKIVDSERFSANLWGKLIRVANHIYQRNEVVDIGEEKEVGDLFVIDGEPYYVVSCENEYYNDLILQKVNYSKNFNQISQVVTIPSEPRFYEVSERSLVRREVQLMEFLMLSNKKNNTNTTPRFINQTLWKEFVKNIIFGNEKVEIPNFAYTLFKKDAFRNHIDKYKNPINEEELFPSTEPLLDENGNYYQVGKDSRAVIVPLLHFPMRNSIVFEWDMKDNFSANDAVIPSKLENYNTLQPVRYCDVMGRADLFCFKLFYKDDWKQNEIKRLPFAEEGDFKPTVEESIFLLPNNLTIGLDKDNREALSFNYQINLLTEDNSFVTFPNLFGQKNGRLKMLLLNHSVSMFDETVDLSKTSIILDDVHYQLLDDPSGSIKVQITKPNNIDLSLVKSVILYETEDNLHYVYLAKNVESLNNNEKLQDWFIYPVFTN